eukprot:CFRG4824T1
MSREVGSSPLLGIELDGQVRPDVPSTNACFDTAVLPANHRHHSHSHSHSHSVYTHRHSQPVIGNKSSPAKPPRIVRQTQSEGFVQLPATNNAVNLPANAADIIIDKRPTESEHDVAKAIARGSHPASSHLMDIRGSTADQSGSEGISASSVLPPTGSPTDLSGADDSALAYKLEGSSRVDDTINNTVDPSSGFSLVTAPASMLLPTPLLALSGLDSSRIEQDENTTDNSNIKAIISIPDSMNTVADTDYITVSTPTGTKPEASTLIGSANSSGGTSRKRTLSVDTYESISCTTPARKTRVGFDSMVVDEAKKVSDEDARPNVVQSSNEAPPMMVLGGPWTSSVVTNIDFGRHDQGNNSDNNDSIRAQKTKVELLAESINGRATNNSSIGPSISGDESGSGNESGALSSCSTDSYSTDDSGMVRLFQQGPLAWLQKQRVAGVTPRETLQKLQVNLPDDMDEADDEALWKLAGLEVKSLFKCFSHNINVSRTTFPRSVPQSKLPSLDLAGIASYIQSGGCKNIIMVTGAGISTAAGIPDFRSPGTGLYHNLQKYKLPYPQAIFEIDFFKRNPVPFVVLAKELYPGSFLPTISHYFTKMLSEKGLLKRHYTQNIDTLERVAGVDSELLVEAHGSFNTAKCIECHKPYPSDYVKDLIFAGHIPTCEVCPKNNQWIKPDIVFFGEGLPDRFGQCVAEDFPVCDLLIVAGTSLKVQPFASVIDMVQDDCPRLMFNKESCGQAHPMMRMMGVRSGFEFGAAENMRDVQHLGACDDGFMLLAEMLGWKAELEEMVVREHEALRRQWEIEATNKSPRGQDFFKRHMTVSYYRDEVLPTLPPLKTSRETSDSDSSSEGESEHFAEDEQLSTYSDGDGEMKDTIEKIDVNQGVMNDSSLVEGCRPALDLTTSVGQNAGADVANLEKSYNGMAGQEMDVTLLPIPADSTSVVSGGDSLVPGLIKYDESAFSAQDFRERLVDNGNTDMGIASTTLAASPNIDDGHVTDYVATNPQLDEASMSDIMVNRISIPTQSPTINTIIGLENMDSSMGITMASGLPTSCSLKDGDTNISMIVSSAVSVRKDLGENSPTVLENVEASSEGGWNSEL